MAAPCKCSGSGSASLECRWSLVAGTHTKWLPWVMAVPCAVSPPAQHQPHYFPINTHWVTWPSCRPRDRKCNGTASSASDSYKESQLHASIIVVGFSATCMVSVVRLFCCCLLIYSHKIRSTTPCSEKGFSLKLDTTYLVLKLDIGNGLLFCCSWYQDQWLLVSPWVKYDITNITYRMTHTKSIQLNEDMFSKTS